MTDARAMWVGRGERLFSLLLVLLCLGTVAPVRAQLFWPQPEYAAKVMKMNGDVRVMKDGQPWALYPGSQVQMRQVIVTGPDGYAQFQVSDGSTFEVFPNSEVQFRNNPGNWRDLLDVWIGRVRVHIEKIGGVPNPQKVRTPTAIISVRGTTFDVVVDNEENSTFIVVDEGQVVVAHAMLPEDTVKVLNSGDTLRVYDNVPLADSRFNRLNFAQRVLRTLADAAQTMILQSPTPGSSGGKAPGGLPGDTPDPANRPGPGAPPPPPPPPPPPLPPGA